jgi:Tfp pilus assembly protein PilX
MTPFLRRQRGATLIVSLIMLLLITLLAISSFTVGKSNLQIVGNMQQRTQALAAAQSAIATVISSIQFTATPADAIRNACGGGPCADGNVTIDCNGANTACVDSNGDGVADVNVAVGVTCDSVQPVPLSALDLTKTQDQNCTVSTQQGGAGVPGSVSNNSLCSDTVWDVQASATDVMSGANYIVDQGVGVRVQSTATPAQVCP